MKHLERFLTLFIILFFIFIVLFVDFGSQENKIIVYDCNLLEYYNNVPKELREECKDLKLKEENELPRSSSRFQSV